MSDSFMVAGTIPMSREEFERRLDTPTPDLGVIANPGRCARAGSGTRRAAGDHRAAAPGRRAGGRPWAGADVTKDGGQVKRAVCLTIGA
ncbi:hypothetical protein ABZ816_00715 [Actinosynnema sp. NPDC047251]|uniref:hypothetical protein n=1 Tax=Saccharothrix espanaensis TaxID=103731 RepID=UPI000301EDE0|nr:hypothetical protein [Saccharothrix espanaensis]